MVYVFIVKRLTIDELSLLVIFERDVTRSYNIIIIIPD